MSDLGDSIGNVLNTRPFVFVFVFVLACACTVCGDLGIRYDDGVVDDEALGNVLGEV